MTETCVKHVCGGIQRTKHFICCLAYETIDEGDCTCCEQCRTSYNPKYV